MKLKIIREENNINAAIDCMQNNIDMQDLPELGPFWYDVNKKECFGVHSSPAVDCPWYESKQFNCKVKTGRALHQAIWSKEQHRGKDSRFKGDFKLTPRGRVFQFENGKYTVCVGKWLDSHPEAKDIIVDEFQLPKNNTEFKYDFHWDIGHGLSQEF